MLSLTILYIILAQAAVSHGATTCMGINSVVNCTANDAGVPADTICCGGTPNEYCCSSTELKVRDVVMPALVGLLALFLMISTIALIIYVLFWKPSRGRVGTIDDDDDIKSSGTNITTAADDEVKFNPTEPPQGTTLQVPKAEPLDVSTSGQANPSPDGATASKTETTA